MVSKCTPNRSRSHPRLSSKLSRPRYPFSEETGTLQNGQKVKLGLYAGILRRCPIDPS